MERDGSFIYTFFRSNKKNKKATNHINYDDKCFQHAATVALSHEEIRKKLQGISKINPFIDEYNLNGINYPSRKDA